MTIHPPARLVGEPKKTKKEGRKEGRKKDTRNSGKLAILPDHPRRRIKIKLCMVGGLPCVVIHVKCDKKSVRGLRRCGGSKMALSYYFGQWLIQQLVLQYYIEKLHTVYLLLYKPML